MFCNIHLHFILFFPVLIIYLFVGNFIIFKSVYWQTWFLLVICVANYFGGSSLLTVWVNLQKEFSQLKIKSILEFLTRIHVKMFTGKSIVQTITLLNYIFVSTIISLILFDIFLKIHELVENVIVIGL